MAKELKGPHMSEYGIQRGEPVAIVWLRIWTVHLASVLVVFVPVTPALVLTMAAGFFIRVFAWEAGSHRYFSHRSYKTSRAFQLALALLAAASAQRGPIWWATKHRAHHRHSDEPGDPHSPIQRGFWYAHLGWLLDEAALATDLDAAKDLTRFRELVWVNKYHYLFPYSLALLFYFLGQFTDVFGRPGLGWSAVAWGFLLPTLLSLHATAVVNTLTHGQSVGWLNRRPFNTADTSSNSWILCIPTLGATWHNNHHRYMSSARAGFYWWEIDIAYYTLRLLALLGIVWDLRPVPESILREGKAGGYLAQPSQEAEE